ncbi:MAG: hypothetical protein ACYDCJ_13015 [Gammaproteobacteria bacterium]
MRCRCGEYLRDGVEECPACQRPRYSKDRAWGGARSFSEQRDREEAAVQFTADQECRRYGLMPRALGEGVIEFGARIDREKTPAVSRELARRSPSREPGKDG